MINHILTKEELKRPENIQIEGLSFHMEEGHKISNGNKAVDYLVTSLPISDPDDYIARRHSLVIAASGDRIIVKIPMHRQSQYNTFGLYGDEGKLPTADKHKEMATRMKTLIKSGQENKLVNMFSIKLPWKVTNKYTVNSTGKMMYEEGEPCVSWAGEETLTVQENLKTQCKFMAQTKLMMPILSLEFRVAIPETITFLEVCVESATDNLAQLTMAANTMNVRVDPSLGA
jgi:hypothetical protein